MTVSPPPTAGASTLGAETPASVLTAHALGTGDLADLRQASLALHDVSMVYPNGKRALADVDLLVPRADFVFLVGPSGAGKTTLIKLLIRDEVATSGVVLLAGHDLARLPRRQVPLMRRRVGTVFQDFKLLPS